MIFFDSHGQAWIPCRASARGAKAFGPYGCARRATDHELRRARIWPLSATPYGTARRQGRVQLVDEWHWLAPLKASR